MNSRFPLSFLQRALTGSFVLCVTVTVAHAGDYYKWKDAHGTVHFSATPPAHKAKTISVEDAAPTPVPQAMAATPPTPEQSARAKATQSALQKANATAVTANCATARQNMLRLQQRDMLAENNDKDPSKPHVLNPEQRAMALDTARSQTAQYCGKQ